MVVSISFGVSSYLNDVSSIAEITDPNVSQSPSEFHHILTLKISFGMKVISPVSISFGVSSYLNYGKNRRYMNSISVSISFGVSSYLNPIGFVC